MLCGMSWVWIRSQQLERDGACRLPKSMCTASAISSLSVSMNCTFTVSMCLQSVVYFQLCSIVSVPRW